MPCDPSDFEAEWGELWCSFCLNIWVRNEDILPTFVCKACNLQHVAENGIEKLDGRYCLYCAKVYEEELLKKMVPAGEMQKS